MQSFTCSTLYTDSLLICCSASKTVPSLSLCPSYNAERVCVVGQMDSSLIGYGDYVPTMTACRVYCLSESTGKPETPLHTNAQSKH